MKILVAADGSPFTKRMLGYLAAHDEWLGPHHQYTVLTVALPVPAHAAKMIDRELMRSYYADEADKVFKPIRTFMKAQGIDAGFVSKVGHPSDVIAKEADSGRYDLLMMGSHGHGLLGSLVLGSVATKVLAGCKVPLLLVR
ncbi:MAG: universal stress protein UspA [Methylibium sp. NZG]|nr:MAG: universal stress protein UspA [Methylibium sp. NZG]